MCQKIQVFYTQGYRCFSEHVCACRRRRSGMIAFVVGDTFGINLCCTAPWNVSLPSNDSDAERVSCSLHRRAVRSDEECVKIIM